MESPTGRKLKIRPRLISETVQFKSGELYNVQKVVDSYSRLQALNLFKFINIVFREAEEDTGEKVLLCDIQLTPMKRQSYNVFLEGTHNSGNIGVGGNFIYNHRNLFRSGENLSLSFWGALKKERFNEGKIFSTKELGVELSLVSPQFWLPFCGWRTSVVILLPRLHCLFPSAMNIPLFTTGRLPEQNSVTCGVKMIKNGATTSTWSISITC